MGEFIKADSVRFIKLGAKGWNWEETCIADSTLRLGYELASHDLCLERRWDELKAGFLNRGSDPGAATRHVNQIKDFYTAPSSWLWITFFGDCMYWCFAAEGVSRLDDGSSIRKAIGGWRNKDVHDSILNKARISGALLAVQGYRGTICSVDTAYVLNKINGTAPPDVDTAANAHSALIAALLPIIRRLHPKDFELLIDLIFRNYGFNRITELGKTEKDIDLALESPVTGELIAVQVKTRSSFGEYMDYRERFKSMVGFDKFFFVTHSAISEIENDKALFDDKRLNYWGPAQVAKLSLTAGLAQWLLDKAV